MNMIVNVIAGQKWQYGKSVCCSQVAFVAWVIMLVLHIKGAAAVSMHNGTYLNY